MYMYMYAMYMYAMYMYAMYIRYRNTQEDTILIML